MRHRLARGPISSQANSSSGQENCAGLQYRPILFRRVGEVSQCRALDLHRLTSDDIFSVFLCTQILFAR